MEVSGSNPVLITGVRHHDTLVDRLWGLVHSREMVDFRVEAGGRQLWAHHIILGLFFNPKQLLDVALQHQHGSNLDSLLKFVYLGAVSVPEDQMDALLELARQLDFAMLVDALLSAKSAIQVAKPSTSFSSTNDATSLEPGTANSSNTMEIVAQTPSDWMPIHFAKPQTIEPDVSVLFPQDVGEIITPDVVAETECDEQLPSDGVFIKTEVDSDEFESQCDQMERSGASSEDDASEAIDMDRFLSTQLETNDDEQADSPQPPSEELNEEFGFDIHATDEREVFDDSEPNELTGAQSTPAVGFQNLLFSLKRNFSKLCDRPTTSCGAGNEEPEDVDPSTISLSKYMENGKFECSVCEQKFNFDSALKVHIRTHTLEKPYKCHVCEKEFASGRYFDDHVRSHSEGNLYKCEVCPKSFVSSSGLSAHSRSHTAGPLYACPECPMKFTYPNVLIKHRHLHENERPHKCKVCFMTFSHLYNLTAHAKIHTDENAVHKCRLCEMELESVARLTEHMQLHADQPNYECHLCYASFMCKDMLTAHARTHAEKKPFQCQVCQQTFVVRYELTKHARTHIAPNQCEICKRKCKTRLRLLRHYKIHTDVKSHICSVCGRGFSRLQTLKSHVKSHSAAKSSAAVPAAAVTE